MNTPRNPKATIREEQPAISFTRVISVAPRTTGFDGWGPSRWN